MARVVFPQEAVVQYVNDLLQIGGLAIRDGATLTRHASSLMSKPHHGVVLGQLRTYANERKQYGAGEVREIVADMETFVDPKIVEQKKRMEAERAERAETRRQKEEDEETAAWEPGGSSFNHAVAQLKDHAHWLIYVAKAVEDSDFALDGTDTDRLIDAMSDWVYSTERERLFAGLKEALKPPPEVSPSPARRCSRRRPNGKDDKVVRLFNDT